MEDSLRAGIEDLIGTYKHNRYLYETIIKTKLDVINSDDMYVNPAGSHGDVLEFLECRVKMQAFNTVINDLETLLRQTT